MTRHRILRILLGVAVLMSLGSWGVANGQDLQDQDRVSDEGTTVVEELTLEEADLLEAAKDKLDDFTCFEITGFSVDEEVTLFHQFDRKKGQEVDVKKPKYLCAPTKKVHYKDDGKKVDFEGPHLKCFNIKPEWAPKETFVTLKTQFGKEKHVKVGKSKLLCVPADKEVEKKGKDY